MRKAIFGSRRALRGAVGLGAAVASLAVFAGAANAQVFVIAPDQPVNASCPASPPASSTLSTAINSANTNSDSVNTIVLTPGLYCPVDAAGQTTLTIAKNLNIVADHSFQNTQGDANLAIEGTDVVQNNNAMFTVPSGVTFTLEGSDAENDPNNGALGGIVGVQAGGTLNLYGESVIGNGGAGALFGVAGSTINVNESNIDINFQTGIESSGVVNINHSEVTQNNEDLTIVSGGVFNVNNSLIADS